MKFTKNSVGGTIEILAADDFVAIDLQKPAWPPQSYGGAEVLSPGEAV